MQIVLERKNFSFLDRQNKLIARKLSRNILRCPLQIPTNCGNTEKVSSYYNYYHCYSDYY